MRRKTIQTDSTTDTRILHHMVQPPRAGSIRGYIRRTMFRPMALLAKRQALRFELPLEDRCHVLNNPLHARRAEDGAVPVSAQRGTTYSRIDTRRDADNPSHAGQLRPDWTLAPNYFTQQAERLNDDNGLLRKSTRRRSATPRNGTGSASKAQGMCLPIRSTRRPR
jgi:hypothetical protein